MLVCEMCALLFACNSSKALLNVCQAAVDRIFKNAAELFAHGMCTLVCTGPSCHLKGLAAVKYAALSWRSMKYPKSTDSVRWFALDLHFATILDFYPRLTCGGAD